MGVGAGILTFAAAAVAHLVFQAVVTVVVYPGLADTARTVPDAAPDLHARYTARMAAVVAPVYGLLAVGTAAVVLDPPPGTVGEWLPWVAVTTSVATVLITGLVAVPLHRALSARPAADPAQRTAAVRHRDAARHGRLAAADAGRLALAAVQATVALVAVAALVGGPTALP